MTDSAAKRPPWERSHPWLAFEIDYGRLRHSDWLALGEAAAMIDRIVGAPLDPAAAEEIHAQFLARGALASAAIEGNTLSEDEARSVIEGTLQLPPSRRYLGRELRNIVVAMDELSEEVRALGRLKLTVERIEAVNRAVLADLEADDHVTPGRVRRTNVTVGCYRCPEWAHARPLLARLCEFLNGFGTPGENSHAYSILKAIYAHLCLVWIHPFGDGNGRTARLIEFAILLEAGLPIPACHLASIHYNLTRTEYYRQLARASQREYGAYGFMAYAASGLADQLREQAGVIQRHQWDAAWTNHIHEEFRGAGRKSAWRQRALVLALSKAGGTVPLASLPDLDPEVARAYAGVSRRTLLRDVAALAERGLVAVRNGRARADRERVLSFRSQREKLPVESD